MRRRRRLGGPDERMNGKIESLLEHHGNSEDLSYLVFYSYPLTLFILVFLFILKYRPIFIFQLESDIFPVMAGTIQYVAFFFNFFPFHDRLNWPTVCSIFLVEPWFVRFSQNSCIPGFLCLKNRILVRFPVFPVGPSGPV